MIETIYSDPDFLEHHGVKGMKWGVRHDPKSMGGRARRVLAGVYGLNEKTYSKLGNKTLASMNASEKKRQLSMAKAADARKAEKQRIKKEQKREAKIYRQEAKRERVAEKDAALRDQINKQNRVAEQYSKEHTVGGIVVRQLGKTAAQDMGIILAGVSIAALSGPAAAPIITSGASAASKIIALNNAGMAINSIKAKTKEKR